MSQPTPRALLTAQTLSARAIYLSIHPTPKGISQTRKILSLLKGYGEVTMFRNLKFDRTSRVQNAILAVFRTPEQTEGFLRSSPHRIMMPAAEKPYNPPSVASAGLGELFGTVREAEGGGEVKAEATASNSSTNVAEEDKGEVEGGGEGEGEDADLAKADGEVEFEIMADKSFVDHRATIQRQRLYWGFVPEKSFVNDALRPDVPFNGLANMPPAHDMEHKSRIVQKNIKALAERKTLREMSLESVE